MPALDGQNLFDNFVHAQVAFPAFQPAGAKPATISASDLGGNTEGVAIAPLAVEGRIGGDQDAFDHRLIVKTPKKLLGRVVGALFSNEIDRLQRIGLAQLVAKGGREITHGS